MININTLPPFKKMCVTIGNLPSSFMESMSYYEALCWLYDYFEKTLLPAINTNSEAITELQTAFTTLKTYIDNYFDDLNVQEEINNKLDAMAESGELTEIIAQYLELAGILAYNTLSDLAGAENLSNGSFTKIYGKTTYNDGYGAFYKIRTLINTDVIDGDKLVALTNYPTLVAEKMEDTILNDLVDKDLTEMVVIGDSFSSRTYLVTPNKLWCEIVSEFFGLTLHNYADPGSGYVHQGDERNSTFYTQLNEAYTDTTFNNSKVKYLFIYGGTNDLRYGSSDNKTTYTTAMSDTMARAREYFPNAIIYYLGSNSFANMYLKTMSDSEKVTELWIDYSVKNSSGYKNNNISCIDLTFFFIGMDNYFTDGLYSHPNATGHIELADAVIKGITGSSHAFNHHVSTTIGIGSATSTWTTSNTLTGDNKFDLYLNDKNVRLYFAACFTTSSASAYVNVEIPYNIRFPYNRLTHYTPATIPTYAIGFSSHTTSGITSQGCVTSTYNQGSNVINVYKNYSDSELIYDFIHDNTIII